jgi:hypothetical protein
VGVVAQSANPNGPGPAQSLGIESSPKRQRKVDDPSEMWTVDGATMLADAPVDADAKQAAAEVMVYNEFVLLLRLVCRLCDGACICHQVHKSFLFLGAWR